MRNKHVLLGLLALAAFFPFLGRRQIVTSHEARVAQTARLMAASGWPWSATLVETAPVKLVTDAEGHKALEAQWAEPPIRVNPWLVPVMSGEIRLQKPPLPYWCAATLYRLAGGEWSEALSRFVPALMGAVGTFLVFGIGRRLIGRTGGWAAALVWVSGYFMPEQYRFAMADPYISFFTLLAFWAWVRGWVIFFYVALALSVLSKGPIFVALAVGVVLYHVCYRRRLPGTWVAHLVGLALFVAIAAPWYAYVYRHVENVMAMWKYESVGELPGAGNDEKLRPVWFYLPGLFQITLPWTPVWVAGIVLAMVRRKRREVFAVSWYFVTVLVFSILKVKKNAYLLPVMPAQVLITGQALAYLLAIMRRRPPSFSGRPEGGALSRGASMTLPLVQSGIGVAGAIAAIVLCATRLSGQARFDGLVLSAVALAGAASTITALRAGAGRTWLLRQAGTYVLALVAIKGIYAAEQDNRRSAKDVCAELTALMAQTGETLAPAKRPEEAALYLPLRMPRTLDAATMLVVVDDPPVKGKTPTTKPSPSRFSDRVPWREVVGVERVEMKTAPGDAARWKVYRLSLR